MDATAHVFDATQENFEAEVIQASLTTPVLVDFWAPWCGPCKTLGPLLEKVVGEYQGSVKLAKVDTDAQMQLASIFGIRSLPTVVMVKDGQMIDGFTGALPESGVRQFIERNVGPPAPVATVEAPPATNESPVQAVARLRGEIAAQPERTELALELALALLRAGDADAAAAALDSLPDEFAKDARARRARSQLEFSRVLKDAPDEASLRAALARDPNDHAARDLLGVRLLLGDDPGEGLEEFLTLLAQARSWNDGQAKQRLIAAFSVLDDDELVARYRRRMSTLLF